MSVTSLLLLDETKRRHVIANSLELVEMTKGKVRMSSPLTSPTPCGHPHSHPPRLVVIPTHIPHALWSSPLTSPTPCGHPHSHPPRPVVIPTHIPHALWSSPLTSPTPCGHPHSHPPRPVVIQCHLPTVFGHGWQELMLLYLLNLSMMHH